MKKYISVLALSACMFSSCSDFLDVRPEGSPVTNAYFTNDQQAIDAIDGLYAPVHQEKGFGRELFWEQGAACDIVWGRTRGYNTLATFDYTGDGTLSRALSICSIPIYHVPTGSSSSCLSRKRRPS